MDRRPPRALLAACLTAAALPLLAAAPAQAAGPLGVERDSAPVVLTGA